MSDPSNPKQLLRDPQNIIAIGVTVISLCALIVSIMQTNIMLEEREISRQYSRASVWPHLELWMSKAHDTTDRSITQLALTLTNSGVGPAIVTDVRISYDGQPARSWKQLFELQNIPDSLETYITNQNFNKRVIRIGESIEILNLNINIPLARAFYALLEHLSIEIYYESIYGEKWKYEQNANGEAKTIPLDEYKRLPESEQFNN